MIEIGEITDEIIVSEYPSFEYSMSQVAKAGKFLKEEILWSDEDYEHIVEMFRIANNWRDSHMLPMRRMRMELVAQLRKAKLKGVTAARVKRMPSIRRKLQRLSTKLNQIQDLGGCRVILPTVDDVNLLVTRHKEQSRHIFREEDNYIACPKSGGYRSHHLVYKFQDDGAAESYSGRRIEVQVRTRLQHSWATAVEAVGLLRNEDLKAGIGDADWLRLFELVSAEFALDEGCQEPSNVPGRSERVAEIKELNRTLGADKKLEQFRAAVARSASYYPPSTEKSEYYLIRFDNAHNSVDIKLYSKALAGTASYGEMELQDSKNRKNVDAVLVEVDKVENLREAYPNYFGDVALFTQSLRKIAGLAPLSYSLPPQELAPRRPKEKPYYPLFQRSRRW